MYEIENSVQLSNDEKDTHVHIVTSKSKRQ